MAAGPALVSRARVGRRVLPHADASRLLTSWRSPDGCACPAACASCRYAPPPRPRAAPTRGRAGPASGASGTARYATTGSGSAGSRPLAMRPASVSLVAPGGPRPPPLGIRLWGMGQATIIRKLPLMSRSCGGPSGSLRPALYLPLTPHLPSLEAPGHHRRRPEHLAVRAGAPEGRAREEAPAYPLRDCF